jgi:hypothetical protein
VSGLINEGYIIIGMECPSSVFPSSESARSQTIQELYINEDNDDGLKYKCVVEDYLNSLMEHEGSLSKQTLDSTQNWISTTYVEIRAPLRSLCPDKKSFADFRIK